MANRYGFHSGIVKAKSIVVGDNSNPSKNPAVISGSGVPAMYAAKGTLYVNITATTTITRLYINTDGANTWTTFTTAA